MIHKIVQFFPSDNPLASSYCSNEIIEFIQTFQIRMKHKQKVRVYLTKCRLSIKEFPFLVVDSAREMHHYANTSSFLLLLTILHKVMWEADSLFSIQSTHFLLVSLAPSSLHFVVAKTFTKICNQIGTQKHHADTKQNECSSVCHLLHYRH